MTIEVPLTHGFVALIDDEDRNAVLAVGSWQAYVDDRRVYARRSFRRSGVSVAVQLHTFLTNWPLVDHRNGDGLDNRRANLRQATSTQNQANARRRRDNTSGFKGVYFNEATGKWMARIGIAGKRRYLGLFETPEEGARAYDTAAIELWGEFARPNFTGQAGLERSHDDT